MTCDVHQIEGGAVAIVCSRHPGKRQKCACGARASLLCDWKVPARRSGTCDEPICQRCAAHVAKNKDLCKAHALQWASHPANPARSAVPATADA
jgi:hypothetical protein